MHPILYCPVCKIQLNQDNSCKKCSKNYFKNGYFDFLTSETNDKKNNELENILKEIEKHGYKNGLKVFFKNNKKELERFSIIEGDIAFRCINRDNSRCLVLNSDMGNISENISNIFEEVYSLENEVTKILFQKKRFDELNKKNVILVKTDFDNIPFPDKFFDLIILNGINFENQKYVVSLFNEIKRLLTQNGCFCLGTENKTSLLSTEKNFDSTEQIFSHNYDSCMSILKKSGFNVNSFWNFGSLKRPYFLVDFNDKNQIKWFCKNLKNFFHVNIKVKIFFWFLGKSNLSISQILIKKFASSFIFYCYKDDISNIFGKLIEGKTSTKSMLQQFRFRKISFILFDKNGKPKNKISSERKKNLLNQDICIVKNSLEKKLSDSQLIIEDWIEGKTINSENPEEIKLVMEWLVDFQNKSANGKYDQNKIKNELTILKEHSEKINELQNIPLKLIINRLEKFFVKCNLKNVTSHGDFAPHNILINNSGNIEVIDWELIKENTNPFKDISKIIFHMCTTNGKLDLFKEKVNNISNNSTFKITQKIFDEHFKVKINIVLLLQYFILNHMVADKNIDRVFFSNLISELLKIEKNQGNDLINYE